MFFFGKKKKKSMNIDFLSFVVSQPILSGCVQAQHTPSINLVAVHSLRGKAKSKTVQKALVSVETEFGQLF